VERDDDQARHWLGKAARGGRLFAMAALAEMDLADGRPMDAMVWSQLMVLYARRYPPEGATRAPEYAADLIYRAYDALTSADAKAPRQRQSQALLRAFKQATDAEILKNVNAFLATEGPAIDAAFRERALAKEQPRVDDPNCPALYDPGRWPLEVVRNAPGANVVYTRAPAGMRRAGYGFFHVTVAPDGSVSRVLLVDALPNAEYGAGLQPEVEKLRFNAIEAAPVRDALLPMSYSTGAVKLTN
jgi:hypothetical protein